MKDSLPSLKTITSADNGKYKTWQKLLTKKYRERERCFLVEGEVLIGDALLSGASIKEVILRDGSEGAIDFISGLELSEDVNFFSLAGNLFDNLSQTENGRDIIGVFSVPEEGIEAWADGDILVLDRIQDPGNMGTIIRTSDAAGVAGIIVMKGTVDAFSPKVVRAAAGSLFRVPIIEAEDGAALKAMLKKLNAVPMALDVRGAIDLYDMPDEERAAIIVGNEGAGISEELLKLSETKLKIPMREGIESLNAAMAFGIVIYERVRRRCRKS